MTSHIYAIDFGLIARSAAPMRLLLLILCTIIGAHAQWEPFVQQYGPIPVDWMSPGHTIALQEEWAAKARPGLNAYANLVEQILLCNRFTIDESEAKLTAQFSISWQYRAKVRRGGLSMEILIYSSTPLHVSPEAFAARVMEQWKGVHERLQRAPWEKAPDGYEVANWRELFLYQDELPKCQVVFSPGQTCSLDIGAGSIAQTP